MPGLSTQTEFVSAAAADVAKINSAISAAKSAAAFPTTNVLAAASDDVSAGVAQVFGSYAHDYQAILKQASSFHDKFAAALASAGKAYSAAESANATVISGALDRAISPIRSLLGGASASSTALASLDGTTYGLVIGGLDEDLNYLNESFTVAEANASNLFAPYGLYPLTGLKDLTLTVSVAQGVEVLDAAITSTLAAHPGDSVGIFGYSQSAIISSIEMENLAKTDFGGTQRNSTWVYPARRSDES